MEALKICNTCKREFKDEKDFFQNTSRWRVCEDRHLWFNCACGSTLFLKQGKYPWFTPSQTMPSDAASIFVKLEKKASLPYVPTVVSKLLSLLKDQSKVDYEEIAEIIIRYEPLLATEIIMVAQNLLKLRGGGPTSIMNLVHAVVYIGYDKLVDVVTLAFLKAVDLKTTVFSSQDFWEHAYVVAAMSQKIAEKFTPYHDIEKVYLGGYLCNVGKIIAAFYFPEEMDAILEDLKDEGLEDTWEELELVHGIYDHRILGEIAVGFWGLPEYLNEIIMKHHDVRSRVSKFIEPYEVVALANQVAQSVCGVNDDKDSELTAQLIHRFKMTREDFDTLIAEASDFVSVKKLA